MLGDIIGEILGEVVVGKSLSERLKSVVRILFGLTGAILSLVGMFHTASYSAGLPFRLAGMLLFAAIGCFCFFNIMLLRKWKWPGRLCIISLPLLFLVRIIFGA